LNASAKRKFSTDSIVWRPALSLSQECLNLPWHNCSEPRRLSHKSAGCQPLKYSGRDLPRTERQKHKQSANDLWIIREKYLSLLVDLRMKEKPLEALQQQRDELVEELHAVYGGAPSTTFQAYKKTQEAFKQYEDMSFTDAEIDAFLPKELKRTLA